jgi:hypothetical protein
MVRGFIFVHPNLAAPGWVCGFSPGFMGIDERCFFPCGSVQHTDEDVDASRTQLFDPDKRVHGKFIMIVSIINLTNAFYFQPTCATSF